MSEITIINPFEIPTGREDAALEMYDTFAAYFSKQDGYISTDLHQALGDDAKFHLVSISKWQSQEHFMSALESPELGEIFKNAPKDIVTYPSAYKIIRS